MIRVLLVSLALLGILACGKYGPPVRAPGAKASATPAVSSPAPAANTEECEDPNTPAPAPGRTP